MTHVSVTITQLVIQLNTEWQESVGDGTWVGRDMQGTETGE